MDGKTTDITAEIPFDIPDTWAWVRLKNICSKIGSGSTPTGGRQIYVSKGVKFLREQNIYNEGLRCDGIAYITEEINEKHKGSQVFAKDILMNITGGSIGRTALVSDGFDIGNINQHILIIRLGDLNTRFYLHDYLCSPYIISLMYDKQTGDKPGLSMEKVSRFLVAFPPLNEQQRIVSQIETLLAEVDTIDADAAALDNALTLAKQKILDLAIRGKLVPQKTNDEPASELLKKIKAEKEALVKSGKIKRDKHESFIFRGDDNRYYEQIDGKAADITSEIPFDLPKSWTWTRLGVLTILTMGQSPDGSSVSECANGVEFHQGKLFFSNKILNKSAQYTSEPTRIVPAGSVLVCVRAPVGTVNITHRSICIGRGLAAVTPVILNTEFIYNWLESLKKYLIEQATGSTFVSVSADQVRNLLFPLPPKKEQEHILKIISSTISMLARIE